MLEPSETQVLGERILSLTHALCEDSETPPGVTRRSFTAEHRAVMDRLGRWMREAGMSVRTDAAGNLVARHAGDARPGAPMRTLLTGSHLDTVRDAGRYDGLLGVVLPLVCVEWLRASGRSLPFDLEILGFCDEEGVRFQSTLLGSRAMAGGLPAEMLARQDGDGISLAQAMRTFGLDPGRIGEADRSEDDILGFVEVHIEQGPVLEAENLPVGVVTAIAGASRFDVGVTGTAGHAGTVPMSLREDALCAAAEAVLAVEHCCAGHDGVVGTVGRLSTLPGAVNVIPGQVSFSLDLRAPDDGLRAQVREAILARWDEIATRRGVRIAPVPTHDNDGCVCDAALGGALGAAIEAEGLVLRSLPSGAGHDAMAMAALCPVAMLFVRCEKGISHHPDEAMTAHDAGIAAAVLLRFLCEHVPTAGTGADG